MAEQPNGGERVSTLMGDRPCASCAYNLVGQPILREPHYQMLIVRCPECGEVASVQEYPLLGRWVGRWAAAAAAVWFIFIVAALVGSIAMAVALNFAVADVGSDDYGDYLQDRFSNTGGTSTTPTIAMPAMPTLPAIQPAGGAGAASSQVQPAQPSQAGQSGQGAAGGTPTQNPATAIVTPGTGTTIVVRGRNRGIYGSQFPQWWAKQDKDALLADAGGWPNVLDPEALWVVLAGGLATFAVGCFWAVMILHTSRRRLLIFGAVVMGAVAALMTMFFITLEPRWLGQAAVEQLGPRVVPYSLALLTIAFITGLMIGRSIVRGLVRAFLPPRLRSSLAFLWTVEGLKPPKGDPRTNRPLSG